MRTLGIAILLVAACKTPDPAYYSSDGRLLKDMAPLNYRIAVAPVDTAGALDDPAASADSALQFSYDDAQLHKKLVGTLRGLHMTSEVVRVKSTDAEELRRRPGAGA